MRFPVLRTPLLTGAAFCFLTLCAKVYGANQQWTSAISALDSTSPVLSEARLRLIDARLAYESSRAFPNPVATIEMQHLEDGSISEQEQTIGVHQPLGFLWYRNSNSGAKKLHLESEQAHFDEARREVTSELILTIVQLYNLREQRSLLDSVFVAAHLAKQAMNARLREGDVSEYDAQRVEAELVEVEFRKQELESHIRTSEQNLVDLTGFQLKELRELPMPQVSSPPFSDASAALQFAREHRPKISAVRMQYESTRKSRAAARMRQLPELGFGLARKAADPNMNGFVLEAEIELPLWGHRAADRRAATENLSEAERMQSVIENSVICEVEAAMERWSRINNQNRSPFAYGITDALLGLNRGVRLYETGEFGALELVDALRTSIDALAASQSLMTERTAALLEVRRVTGLNILE